MTQNDTPTDPKPDPILESLRRADREHADRPTNRRWFWRFLVPFVLVFIFSMAYVAWRAVHQLPHQ
jgi:hypothetical protein